MNIFRNAGAIGRHRPFGPRRPSQDRGRSRQFVAFLQKLNAILKNVGYIFRTQGSARAHLEGRLTLTFAPKIASLIAFCNSRRPKRGRKTNDRLAAAKEQPEPPIETGPPQND